MSTIGARRTLALARHLRSKEAGAQTNILKALLSKLIVNHPGVAEMGNRLRDDVLGSEITKLLKNRNVRELLDRSAERIRKMTDSVETVETLKTRAPDIAKALGIGAVSGALLEDEELGGTLERTLSGAAGAAGGAAVGERLRDAVPGFAKTRLPKLLGGRLLPLAAGYAGYSRMLRPQKVELDADTTVDYMLEREDRKRRENPEGFEGFEAFLTKVSALRKVKLAMIDQNDIPRPNGSHGAVTAADIEPDEYANLSFDDSPPLPVMPARHQIDSVFGDVDDSSYKAVKNLIA